MTAPAPALQELAVSALAESPSNPRKTWGDLGELVDSIREKGVLQPILARPLPGPGGGAVTHEVVFGHRRLRAAKKAGLATIPAIVRSLDNRAALEAQVIENGQREDIHPLEEALGYQLLHEEHGYTVEELAAKVAKSKSYVYQRLQLCALVEPARKAFLAGKLAASVAHQLTRVPADLQPQALKEITQERDVWDEPDFALDGLGKLPDLVPDAERHEVKEFTNPGRVKEAPSAKEAIQILRLRYMLSLSAVPWELTDADLVPEAGACSTCPKRTGTQRELFPDVKSPDVCTDPSCFARKRATAMAQLRAKAEAAGRKILTGKEAEAVLTGRSHVDPDNQCWEDPRSRTYRALLGKRRLEEHAVLVEQKDGDLVERVPASVARQVLKKSRASSGASSNSAGNSYAAAERQREAKARLERRIRGRILEGVVAKVRKLERADLEMILGAAFSGLWHEHQDLLAKRWGVPERRGSYQALDERAQAFASTLKPAELAARLMEVALVKDATPSTYNTSKPAALLAAAKRHGVDAAAIRREETVAARQAAKEKAARKRKSAKKKVAKKSPRTKAAKK